MKKAEEFEKTHEAENSPSAYTNTAIDTTATETDSC